KFETIERKNEKYIDAFDTDSVLQFIQAKHGSGKTYRIFEREKKNPNDRMVYISISISQIKDFTSRINKDGKIVECYDEINGDLSRARKVATTLESLHRYKIKRSTVPDVLYLDELNAIIRNFESHTVTYHFNQILRN